MTRIDHDSAVAQRNAVVPVSGQGSGIYHQNYQQGGVIYQQYAEDFEDDGSGQYGYNGQYYAGHPRAQPQVIQGRPPIENIDLNVNASSAPINNRPYAVPYRPTDQAAFNVSPVNPTGPKQSSVRQFQEPRLVPEQRASVPQGRNQPNIGNNQGREEVDQW